MRFKINVTILNTRAARKQVKRENALLSILKHILQNVMICRCSTCPCLCFIDCHNPHTIVNGLLSHTTTLYGDVAYVTCDTGFTASVNVIACSSDGTWSEVPICTPVGKDSLYG